MNYPKAEATLKLQLLRMQLETIAYVRIKLKKSDRKIVNLFSKLWLDECTKHNIKPENSFVDEYNNFEQETVLKFAPDRSLINMETKSLMALKKHGFDTSEVANDET